MQEALNSLIEDRAGQLKASRDMQLQFAENGSAKEIETLGAGSLSRLKRIIEQQYLAQLAEVQNCRKAYKNAPDTLEEELAGLGLYKRELVIGNFLYPGDVWDVCYFDKGRVDLDEWRVDFFREPVSAGDYEFAELAFADKKEEIRMRAYLSHGFIQMELTEKQYAAFQRLGISHEVQKK